MAYNTWGTSWGTSWSLSWTRGATPDPDPGWLGGGAKDADYHRRKKQLEELDRIDENIRKDKLKQAAKLLSETDKELPVEIPEIRKIDKAYIKEFRQHQLNIEALKKEIALLREYILAQQIFEEKMARELDDESAFLLMLN